MGLWNFAKSVGAKIFGGSEAQAATAEELKKEAEKHGLDMSGVEIQVDGDKVKLSGKALTTEQAEKITLAIGNTTGVASVENNIAAATPTAESKTYTVEKGDTLWKIAEEMYGKGKGGQYNVIFEANKPMLSHPDKIYPGQVLRVPPLPTASARSQALQEIRKARACPALFCFRGQELACAPDSAMGWRNLLSPVSQNPCPRLIPSPGGAPSPSSRIPMRARPRSPKSCCCSAARSSSPAKCAPRPTAARPALTGCRSNASAAFPSSPLS